VLLRGIVLSLLLGVFAQCSLQAQVLTASEREYHSRLEMVCKVWGYLKYVHPGVNASKSWDDSLIQTISHVKTARSQAEYFSSVERLIAAAGAVTTATTPAPVIPQQLRLPVDYSWMNDRQMLSSSAISTLAGIRENFRPFLSYYIEPSPVGTPQARNENPYPSMTEPNEEYRLLALFRYWNMINYFFPYKDTIGRPWETVLPELIPMFIAARTSNEYYAAVRRMSAQINDSHGFVVQNTMFFNFFGRGSLPLDLRYVQGQTVVSDITMSESARMRFGLQDVRKGDVLLSIDGVSVDTLRKRLAPLVPASNSSALQRDINSLLCRGNFGPVMLKLRRGAREFDIIPTRNTLLSIDFVTDNSQPWRILPENIGYVNMGRLQRASVPKMMEDLMKTRGIIFDIRNYPNGTLYDIGAYLSTPVPFVRFTAINPAFPGVFFQGSNAVSGAPSPLSPPNFIGRTKTYQGKTVALINQETQSHAEFTAMAFRATGMKIIGSQTAGADGNIVSVRLPGDIEVVYTSLGVFYPDGKVTQRIGIVPDIPFQPTVSGMQAGRDEVLERGIKEILGQSLSLAECQIELQANIRPNPASENARLDFWLAADQAMTIRVFNTIGQCVREIPHSGMLGQNTVSLEMGSLAQGLYFAVLESPSFTCRTAIPVIKSR
jgi:C-terminal processing protease CtpA/Prc